jgi:NADH:ubiquinone oxidoreductase subunit
MRLSYLRVLLLIPFLGLVSFGEDKAPEPKADADGFVSLFNGKNLDGWKIGKNAESWKAENGELVVSGPGPAHLFYDGPVHNHDWKNFHLKAELMTKPNANSGIYFHTAYQEDGWPKQGFEAQVNETHGDKKKTGGLYNIKDVMDKSPVNDNEWFTYEIIVEGKHVILKINGNITCDWTEPTPPQPPKGMEGRFLQHGTIALQGHDPKSETHYRSVMIKALPD